MEYVRTLKAIHRADKDLVGERAADLALLEQKDYAVPLTSVLTHDAFEAFITHNKLQEKIGHALSDPDANRSYDKVREHLLIGPFPKEIVAEIVEAYESLDVRPEDSLNQIVEAGDAPYVSVILSPNHAVPAESGEGVILNVKGLEELLIAVKECWACLFTPSMQRHRKEAGIPNSNLNTGVLIQHMPRGDVSAEGWSAAGSDTQHLIVKTYIGALDIGVSVEKDEFKLTREYLKPILSSVAVQTEMYARDEEGRLGKVPIGERGEEQKLNDKIVIELARLSKKASQVIDGHVKLHFNVDNETIKTLLCTRLLLTKGSIKLEGYEAEERIEEEAMPATGEHVEVESETTTVEVDDESGEEEVVEQEHAVVSEEALDQESIEDAEELAPEPVEEPVEEESPVDAPGTGEEPSAEETPEPTPEVEEESIPEEPEEEPVEEEPTPESVEEEPEEESIFAGVEQESVPEPVAEPEEEEPETVEEEPFPEVEEEPAEEEPLEAPETEEEPPAEETPEPTPELGEESEYEAPEPVEEEPKESAYTEVKQEETVVEVDEETGEEEVVSDDREGAVVEGDVPTNVERTLEEAYSLAKEALTERYEKRFKNPPPSDMKDLFFELSSEVIIPHEDLIGRMVKTIEDDEEYDQEFEERIASVLDEFLEQIK